MSDREDIYVWIETATRRAIPDSCLRIVEALVAEGRVEWCGSQDFWFTGSRRTKGGFERYRTVTTRPLARVVRRTQ